MRNLAWLTASLITLGVGCEQEPRLHAIPQRAGLGAVPEEINPIQIDRIVQVQQPEVDVLFVVDNSCSMYEEQQLLGANFPRFMNYFVDSGLNYHIGVISTDMDDQTNHAGKLRRVMGQRFINPHTTNPEAVFQSMVNMGTGGSFDEKGREAAYTMVELKPDIPRNHDFIREEAALHLVFISDEDDRSLHNPVSRPEFRQWMLNLKSAPDMVQAHSIVGIPGQQCGAIDTAGAAYIGYSQATGGIVFNLCEPNWGPLLDELGLQTAGLKREYFLSKIPVLDPWTLDVKVITEDDSGQHTTLQFTSCLAGEEFDGCRVAYNPKVNSVTFLDYVPDSKAEVKLTYNIRQLYFPG